MNMLRPEKEVAVIAALVEGNSIRSVERITGIHRDTIMRVLVRIGENCAEIMDKTMRNLRCREIEADEIWCYVGKKQRNVTPEERALGELGDQYTFIAIDPRTKLVPVFVVDKRDVTTTYSFIRQLRERIKGRIQLSTDAFTTYNDVVDRVFGSEIDYAQVIKHYEQDLSSGRYSPPALSSVEKIRVQGQPQEATVSTSYVERNNLTFRMQMRRFTRLTNGFSKKLANLRAMIYLWVAYYNFCRVHRSLRVTPAMAAGLTDHVWEIRDLLAV